MYKGGSIYSPATAKIFRYAGLFIPIILAVYGLLIQLDLVKKFHTIDNISFLIFCFWWLYISVIQFLVPSKTKLDIILRLVAYHLLAASYLVFIAGVASPFVACWLLLMVTSYSYFSERGLQFSALAFAIVIFCDIALWNQASSAIITYDIAALITIVIISIVALYICKTKKNTKIKLGKSKVQESLQRDRILTIVNNMTDAVFSTNKDGIIQIYNASSLNLLDTNENLKGEHIDNVLTLTDQDDNKISIFDEFANSKTAVKRDDLNYTYKDGEKIRLEITYSPIRSSYSRHKKAETHDGFIVIMRDVTKSKSLEEERDEFISVVSHELRTPIAIAEGTISNAQVMIGHKDVTNEMLQDSINVAHDQIMFLSNMVNDLSALSRAERGVADTAEEIDVRELAHKLHSKYAEEAKSKNLHFDLDLQTKLGKVYVSRLYLEELLQNLMTNSLKYTKEGSITLSISQNDGIVKVSVKDTGIGISKTDQAKIFHKFYRSEDYRTRETSGTGLGLYIAAKLAHKINTKIEMTSRLNFGSTFSIKLPEMKLQDLTKEL